MIQAFLRRIRPGAAAAAIACALLAGGWQSALALEASRIRLLDGGKDGSDYIAALEITLQRGYLTYWRTPGEAGVAPAFDWSGSGNVTEVRPLWPAPLRLKEADSIVYGFMNQVVVPLRVRPAEPGRPASLKLELQYGVCKDICIPVTASADIVLNGTGDNAVVVERAIRGLPRKVEAGVDAPLAVVSGNGFATSTTAVVTLRVPEGETAELFAEGPDGWMFSTSEGRTGARPGTEEFTVRLDASPTGHNGPVPPLRLTARTASQAIETEMALE